jgi:phage RecT family recombinase
MENPIVAAITKSKDGFMQIAPDYMKFESEARFAMNMINANPQLLKAANESPSSVSDALKQAAAIRLSLNPAEKLAYLIPRNIKVADNKWKLVICLEPGYMGLIRLATDSGSISWIQSEVVYANDTFVNNGIGERPTHTYNAFAKYADRGEFVGVYSVAKTIAGDYLTCTMNAEEVLSIRDRSETYKKYKSGTWVSDFTEMAKKAVIRRQFKTLPGSDERRFSVLAEAVRISNENEAFEPIATSPNISQPSGDQKAFYDALIESSDALGMYVFCETIDEGMRNTLYHSFLKGEKGRYQRIVDSLYAKGAAQVRDIVEVINEHARNGDDHGVAENITDLPADAIKIIKDRLSTEAMSIVCKLEAQQ